MTMTKGRGFSAAAVLLAATIGMTACSSSGDVAAGTTSAGVPSTSGTSPNTQSSTSTLPKPTTTTPQPTATTPKPTAPTTTPSPSSTSPKPSPSTTTPKPKPTSTPTTPPPLDDTSLMKPGDKGPAVQRMQQRLSDLGYWLGTPDGTYGYNTSQAVMALQKTAGLGRDGVYGPATRAALERGVQPKVVVSGNAVQINLATQVLTVVENSRIVAIVNTSTGSGEKYVSRGQPAVAITPKGTFRVILQIDEMEHGPLGDLWRPKYFTGGIAVHGSSSVPGYPASHGCARVSNPAMDMIWARNLMPMGRTVVVF